MTTCSSSTGALRLTMRSFSLSLICQTFGKLKYRLGGMFGADIDPDLVTAVMLFTKLVRHKRRAKPKKDDFVDAINYLALAWESQ